MADVIQVAPPFSQGVGYGVIIGLGGAFAIGMSCISLFMSKYFAEKQDSEMFMTAKHSVKTGLTASAVVSSWTIAATLLSSTSCLSLSLLLLLIDTWMVVANYCFFARWLLLWRLRTILGKKHLTHRKTV